jgi:hypothetical protein
MSKMIVNMMELLKAENLVGQKPFIASVSNVAFVPTMMLTDSAFQKPATVKRAYALRETGTDKSMKRILPKAIEQITKAVREDRPSYYQQREHGSELAFQVPHMTTTEISPMPRTNTPLIANTEIPKSPQNADSGIPGNASSDNYQHNSKGFCARNLRAKEASNNIATATHPMNYDESKFWEGWYK